MRTVFVIDGGAGRAITSIPALLKFQKNNPGDDFRICIHGWDTLFWGIPELQDRTFNIDNKGIFENVFLTADRVISPEPYRLPRYYKQQENLVEAFDSLINETDKHDDLENIKLVLTKTEELVAVDFISKTFDNKKMNIIIQPWGSTAKKMDAYTIDESSRSIEPWSYLTLIKKLSQKYNLIYFGDKSLAMEDDNITAKPEGDLRFWMALIDVCDYFVGVDSVGQHFAKAFGTPGSVILGSTIAANISYPEFFNILKKPGEPKYSPLRINMIDSHLADRLNDSRMNFDEKEIEQFVVSIDEHIKKNVKG